MQTTKKIITTDLSGFGYRELMELEMTQDQTGACIVMQKKPSPKRRGNNMKKLTRGEVSYLSGVASNFHEIADRLDPKRSWTHPEANQLTSISTQIKKMIYPYVYNDKGEKKI